ncbi:MAG: hypothetical protein ABH872_00225 [Candidatus Omnitrophota bacterium]
MAVKVSAGRIKIFKIRNRRGFAALCCNHLTEGISVAQAYGRMQKALRRNGIAIKSQPSNIKSLLR